MPVNDALQGANSENAANEDATSNDVTGKDVMGLKETARGNRSGKRVAILLPRLSRYGGMENFGYQLSGRLVEAGYSVDFICSRMECVPPAGVKVICLGRVGLFSPLKMLHFAWTAERQRQCGRYDLSIGLGKSLRQDILRSGGGPQRIFHAKSILAYPAGLPRTLKKLSRLLSPANCLTEIIEKIQMRQTGTIVAVSDLVKDWIIEAHPSVAPEKIQVIYNKPELARFSPIPPQDRGTVQGQGREYGQERDKLLAQREYLRAQWGVAAHEVALGLAGTNFSLKGVEPLIRALALLPKNFKVLVAGGRGSHKYLKLAQELGLNPDSATKSAIGGQRVRFVGKVDDMPGFYRALDMFVLPTFYDACSNVVLEALACGIMSVTSASNGAARFLPPDQVLADPADYTTLARIISRLAEKPAGEPFVWPADRKSGLDAYLELIETLS